MTINKIFEPESIAIIGASNNIKKWGGNILYNLINMGYKGNIYPINYKETIVQGLKCYHSVLDVPNEIDLAIITIPANIFVPILEECGQKRIKAVVGITAGFKEIGNIELENTVKTVLNKYNIRLMGVNCLGILNLDKNINVSVVQQTPKFGGISFICQSGTMGIALIEEAVRNGVGLNKIISTGNKTNIDDVDLLEYLNKDESTKVIAIYAESINRGKEFIEIAKKIKKPIIILKAGRSKKGSKAAFSHTGSMSGSDEIYSVAFKQAGVIRVDEMNELFNTAIIFSQNLPRTNKVGVIMNGGGAGIIITDLCEKFNIEIPDIDQNTKDRIKKVSKLYASINNPVDTAADNSYIMYYECINAMLNDNNIDTLIVGYIHTKLADSIPPAQAIIDSLKNTNKPIIGIFFGGPGYEIGSKMIQSVNVPNYVIPEDAIRSLNYLLQQKKIMMWKNHA